MRDLVFKNLTSKNKSRKILFEKEAFSEDGIATNIQKHLIYFMHEFKDSADLAKKNNYQLFIVKRKDTIHKTETFFVKMKGGIITKVDNKMYIVNFLHSLTIKLSPSQKISKATI